MTEFLWGQVLNIPLDLVIPAYASVIPAYAGISLRWHLIQKIPAFAGMTEFLWGQVLTPSSCRLVVFIFVFN